MYAPADDRYDRMPYPRTGRSGLKLPAISLGLWWNFGHDRPLETSRAIVRRAFDLGITHFDLANNYGPPYGSAEENFGRIFRADLGPYRDELVISSKAGYDMWPGPYGEWGSRKYLLASLDQSLARLGLDYVDIFYSHRFDPETPLEETMGALDTAVRQGKALYAGISSYSATKTREAAAILRDLGTPLLIHQPSYSMLNRWIEPELLDALGELGVGCITFSPLAQGMLTDRYLDGIPEGARASRSNYSLSPDLLTDESLAKIRALNELAAGRGQTLAQMALAWTLRDAKQNEAAAAKGQSSWLEFDPAVLGGHYTGHHGNGPKTKVALAEGAKDHPILLGVFPDGMPPSDFVGNGSLYKVTPLAASATPLLLGTIDGQPAEPIAWTNRPGPKQARVFFTSLGHLGDFETAAFRKLLTNAIFWALDEPYPAGQDVEKLLPAAVK